METEKHIDRCIGDCENAAAPNDDLAVICGKMTLRIVVAEAKRARAIERELNQAKESLNHARQWWGSRSKRLQDWAREKLTGELLHEFFNICANGTATWSEEPTYDRQLVMKDHEIEMLRRELAALKSRKNDRSAFEAWITAPPHERCIERFKENQTLHAWVGQYRDMMVQGAWEAWQA